MCDFSQHIRKLFKEGNIVLTQLSHVREDNGNILKQSYCENQLNYTPDNRSPLWVARDDNVDDPEVWLYRSAERLDSATGNQKSRSFAFAVLFDMFLQIFDHFARVIKELKSFPLVL